jgi:hypothetical protein
LGRRLLGIGAGLLALGLFRFLAGRPEMAESLAGSPPVVFLTRSLSLGSGLLPVSVAEVVVLAVVARQVVGLVGGIGELRRGDDRPPRVLLRGGLRLGQDVGLVVALFVVLWGIQHPRPSLEARLGLAPAGEVTSDELELLARAAVDAANRAYLELHGSSDIGAPTPAPGRRELGEALDRAWAAVVTRYELPHSAASPRGRPKSFWVTPLMKRFGVAGMYFPFTGEALILGDLPGVLKAKEMAHEMAHQRGFASESDANVLAFFVTREATHPGARYAGYVFLQGQLVGALARQEPDRARALVEELLPGVRRDLDARRAYWEVARGWPRSLGVALNDAMLRAHGHPEGIASYRGSTWVFVALAREGGLEALLPPGQGPERPTPGEPSRRAGERPAPGEER